MQTPLQASSLSRRGFTLLETAITLVILALLVGAVFGVLQSSLQMADTVKAEADRELRVQKFVELCENILNRLPPDAVVSIRPQKGFGSQSQMVEIAFALSPFDAATPGIISITSETAKDGSLHVAVGFEEVPLNFASTRQQNTSRPVQVPLLNGIASLQWRVFDPQTQKWIDKWNEKAVAADIIKSGQSTLTGLPPSGQNMSLNLPGTPPANSAQPGVALTPGTPGAGPVPPPAANLATSLFPRPPMLELSISMAGEEPRRWIFWVPASVMPQ